MIDLKRLREDPEYFRWALRHKQRDPALVDRALEADRAWRAALARVEGLRAEQNRANQEIPRLDGTERQRRIDELKQIAAQIRAEEPEVRALREALDRILLQIPNPPHPDVPPGEDERGNVPVRYWGHPPRFDFPTRDHIELGTALGILEFERAAKVSGSRFYFLTREGVILQQALMRFAMESLVQEGFVPVFPPTLVRPHVVLGAMGGAEMDTQQVYHLADDDLALIGTSEHPIVAMHMDEVLDARHLPLRYVGYSTCYRREAGTYGRESRGLYRVHQFDKVEMVSFAHPDRSWEEHDHLVALQERIMQRLGMPYRIVNICGGDLGDPAAKKYDLETWMPGRADYGETHSCSNCTDFQARRLRIRFRDGAQVDFVHTLNGTAIAATRAILAILENGQRADGSVDVPRALVPYTGFDRIAPRHAPGREG
ncbi:MAG: serine--tRNA ligase [Armatimonadota bacterium]|nr:serine--tRNA ligase [Armatimonadota bacterium]MDR5696713.1 serine--tRNA ligase [Armatimonadota bacterium]